MQTQYEQHVNTRLEVAFEYLSVYHKYLHTSYIKEEQKIYCMIIIYNYSYGYYIQDSSRQIV